MRVKARVLEFTSAQSVTVEYTIDTVQNDTGVVIETLGPVQCSGLGPNDIVGELNIDLSGVMANAIEAVVEKITGGSN